MNFISEPVACRAVMTPDRFGCLSKATERASRLGSILETDETPVQKRSVVDMIMI